MTITIQPEHEKLIAAAIESGAYQSPEQVVSCALEVLRAADEELAEDRDELNRKLDRAFAQFENGQFFTPEEPRTDMARHKAKWLAQRA
ncbi:MAG: hypothetical protein FJW31_08690 [Acidobacteria bacterium]|nr:hypothetical protein [Acidobacteriota bacterium]